MSKPIGALLLFSKAPLPGIVKTRLIRDRVCDPKSACLFYTLMLRDIFTTLCKVVKERNIHLIISYTPGFARKEFEEILPECLKTRTTFFVQPNVDVVERVAASFKYAFQAGFSYAILFPGDVPDINRNDIKVAMSALEKATSSRVPFMVIGPAHDGGAYLIGVNVYTPLEFVTELDDANKVSSRLVLFCQKNKVGYVLLENRMDIDDSLDCYVFAKLAHKPSHTLDFILTHMKNLIPNKSKLISVIVPVLNEENTLQHFIRCIKNQSLTDYELIIVDGGSVDNTLSIATKYADRVVVTKNGRQVQENIGACSAKGEILVFIYADIVFPNNLLECIARVCKIKNIVAGSGELKYSSLKIRYRFIEILRKLAADILGVEGMNPFFFVKQEAFWRIGGFNQKVLEEGVDASRKLKKFGYVVRLPLICYASARRFEKKGFVRTLIIWAFTVILSYFGLKMSGLERKIWRPVR